ncbi:hypothetical protein K431DRAFT_133672 [Polychaeton citri CBS 116435]|uniref:Uncharacterized protein n=1 Tax=Polychaeton citri CBS 116435 TaxID=1314669 RepID=A0A9P4QFD8_9PEZI|nr:hypothetical protein K431DRAFT_133672 [Polychaeton citri CBS 116435]
MSPTTYCCSVCGFLIETDCDGIATWLSKFEVLHDGARSTKNEEFCVHPEDVSGEFRFHTACLTLLQACLGGTPFVKKRLLDLCASLPTPLRANSISWDHDYGGLWCLDRDCYPWEDNLIGSTQGTPDHSLFQLDPLDVPELSLIRHSNPAPSSHLLQEA